jgi:hypothetical protein
VNGSTTTERCAAGAWVATVFEATGAGEFVATAADRLAMNKYQEPPAIAMSATIPMANGTSTERFFGSGGLLGRLRLSYGLRLGGNADLQRINPDRLGDVLELGLAEIGDGEVEPCLDLPVRLRGQADTARLANALKPRGDIDAVAHKIAVALLDHIAEMDADAEFDAAFGRQAGIALDQTVLHLDGATHGIDNAAKLNETAVAGSLDDAPVMRVDGGINQIAPQPPEPRQRAILVRSRKTAVSDDIRDQNRRDFPGPRRPPHAPCRLAQRPGQSRQPF